MNVRILESYNVINLLRNGGLDFDEGPDGIPFWEVEGAEVDAVPPDNSYALVRGESPDSEKGAPNYFKVTVSNQPIYLNYDLMERFQSTSAGKVTPPWIHDCVEEVEGGYKVAESQLVRAAILTFALSMRVKSGSVRVHLLTNSGSDEDSFLMMSSASPDWSRPWQTFAMGQKRLMTLRVMIEKVGFSSAEIHLGAFSLVRGEVADLPYTGDFSADVVPKGAIVLAVGKHCPPGYEKLSFAAPKRTGRLFPKSDGGNVEAEGDEVHNHEGASLLMDPEVDWPVVEVEPTTHSPSIYLPVKADEGLQAHSHEMTLGIHVPPSKDVILCRRL